MCVNLMSFQVLVFLTIYIGNSAGSPEHKQNSIEPRDNVQTPRSSGGDIQTNPATYPLASVTRQRVLYKLCVLVINCVSGHAPGYLVELLPLINMLNIHASCGAKTKLDEKKICFSRLMKYHFHRNQGNRHKF